MNKINENKNVFGDNIGYIEEYDFSKANLNEENRIKAVTTVASICYANPKGIGKVSLYDMLANESKGLPSSSYEFVPILLDFDRWYDISMHVASSEAFSILCIEKYGEWVTYERSPYLLTNLRAVLTDKELYGFDLSTIYNTEEECEIIAKHFKVYKAKLDISSSKQYIRHRVSWQELSRRYVSGKKVPFEFYISDRMKGIVSDHAVTFSSITMDTNKVIDICLEHYNQALKDGVKPQEARRIIPQCAYTEIWSSWQPKQLDNFLKLRTKKDSQWEIRQIALQKQEWLDIEKGDK